MAELRMAALGEVLKAGIDASKDISWQLRCGQTQDLAFARVSRAVRLTVLLSAKLEADPGLEGFKPKARAEKVREASAIAAHVGGLGEALPTPALPTRGREKKAAGADAGDEAWDREDFDSEDEDFELDELERDLADDRPVAEILAQACRLMGAKVDLSAFDDGAEMPPAPVPDPAVPIVSPLSAAIRAQMVATIRGNRPARPGSRENGRDPPDG
jgi:hypothetical protein